MGNGPSLSSGLGRPTAGKTRLIGNRDFKRTLLIILGIPAALLVAWLLYVLVVAVYWVTTTPLFKPGTSL